MKKRAKWITEIYKIVEILAFSCPGLSPLLFLPPQVVSQASKSSKRQVFCNLK